MRSFLIVFAVLFAVASVSAATNPKDDADMFLKSVESLMQYEQNAYNGLPTGTSSFDKLARQAAADRVQKKYTELRGITANYVIKTLENFKLLNQKGNDRVQQLAASGKIQEAQALSAIVSQFNHETIEMNKARPVRQFVQAQEYYNYAVKAVKQAETCELLEKALAPAKLAN